MTSVSAQCRTPLRECLLWSSRLYRLSDGLWKAKREEAILDRESFQAAGHTWHLWKERGHRKQNWAGTDSHHSANMTKPSPTRRGPQSREFPLTESPLRRNGQPKVLVHHWRPHGKNTAMVQILCGSHRCCSRTLSANWHLATDSESFSTQACHLLLSIPSWEHTLFSIFRSYRQYCNEQSCTHIFMISMGKTLGYVSRNERTETCGNCPHNFYRFCQLSSKKKLPITHSHK